MENESVEAAARSCQRCIYWEQATRRCLYTTPAPGENNWPVTSADSYCFRWKGSEKSIRVSSLSTETVLEQIIIAGSELMPDASGKVTQDSKTAFKGWAYRSDVINQLNQEQGISKQGALSRIRTLVKYGVLGMSKYPPGVANEQEQVCLWQLDGKPKVQNTEEHEMEPVDLTPGRPKLFTYDTVVKFLRELHNSPAKRIGIRPLHRAISLVTPMSMSTCQRLVEEGVAAGLIQRWETGYWAEAKNSAADSSDIATLEVEA